MYEIPWRLCHAAIYFVNSVNVTFWGKFLPLYLSISDIMALIFVFLWEILLLHNKITGNSELF